MEKRKNSPPERATWPTRQAMVLHGLAMNLPWLAFVNVSFALMILLRNVLFQDSDTLYPIPLLTRIVDASMFGIIMLSAALIIMAWQRIAGISVVLFVCSAIWSITCYWFITDNFPRLAAVCHPATGRPDGAVFLPGRIIVLHVTALAHPARCQLDAK
jgi:hypothetical protein